MTGGRFVVRGEIHLSLETVAECYAVDVGWLEECASFGLLELRLIERTHALASSDLGRVAALMHLRAWSGLDLPGLALWIEGE